MRSFIESTKTNSSFRSHSFFNENKKNGALFFQPRLTVGPTNDRYEQEADNIANEIVGGGNSRIQTKISPVNVQRKCDHCQEEEKLQRKETGSVRHDQSAPAIVSDVVASPGKPLDKGTRTFMEGRFGYDFSNVKIHTDTVAAKSAQSINALAYTSGNSIVFNNDQYSPNTNNGRRLLAHELTHVVQQQGTGNVQRQTDEEITDTLPTYNDDNQVSGLDERDSSPTRLTDDACCGEAYQLPQMNYPFNINEEVFFTNTFCVTRRAFRMRIRSHWATTHSAQHFRAIVYDENGTTRFTRRYNVGDETQTFRFGSAGCRFIRVIIQVFSPDTSPNLVGRADLFY
jgi:hypothetical protein